MDSLWKSIISFLISAFVVIIISIIFVESPDKNLEKDMNGEMILRLNKSVLYVGCLFVPMAALFLIAGFSLNLGEYDIVFLLAISLCILLLGIYMILVYMNKRVVFSDKKVIAYNILGKKTEVYWYQVNKVSAGDISTNIILHSDVEKVKVNCNMIGGEQFIDVMKKCIRTEIYIKALDKIDNNRGKEDI